MPSGPVRRCTGSAPVWVARRNWRELAAGSLAKSPGVRPVSYVLGRKVRYVDQAGKAIDPRLIRAGTRVHLDFDRAGAVKRVVVVEKE